MPMIATLVVDHERVQLVQTPAGGEVLVIWEKGGLPPGPFVISLSADPPWTTEIVDQPVADAEVRWSRAIELLVGAAG